MQGLKDFPADQRPPVAIVYFAFRIMVGIALLMLAVVAAGLVLMGRGALDRTGWYLRLCELASCLGFIAVIAGWTTTEVGRQPWTVYGLLRTADSVSPSLTGSDVALSLLLYVAVYLVIYPVGLLAHAADRLARPGRGRRAGSVAAAAPSAIGARPRRSEPPPPEARTHDADAEPRPDLDRDPGAGGVLLRRCSTASISASACSTISRPTGAPAT